MDVNPLTHGTDWGVPDTDGSRARRARRGRVAAAFSAMAGQAPPRPPVLHILSATLALMVPLIILGAAADATDLALLIPPMAATAALIIGGPDLPLAQPRNVILGHLIGGGIGLLLSLGFGALRWRAASPPASPSARCCCCAAPIRRARRRRCSWSPSRRRCQGGSCWC